jgi:hypothetical protein
MRWKKEHPLEHGYESYVDYLDDLLTEAYEDDDEDRVIELQRPAIGCQDLGRQLQRR